MVAEGLGLPHRWRAAAVTALTGFHLLREAISDLLEPRGDVRRAHRADER
jgi:hypothetical protein